MKHLVFGVMSVLFIPIAALLLFWLGRGPAAQSAEIFSEYDDNDEGEDIDDE